MIHKYYGLEVGDDTRSNEIINDQYLRSPISLGMHREDSFLEKEFLKHFSPFTEDIFLYSDLPEEEIGMGAGNDLSKLLCDLASGLAYGVAGNFLYDLIRSKEMRKEIFKRLKLFLIASHKHKPQTQAIRITMPDGGASAIYKLPKYLNLKQIEIAVEEAEKEVGDEKIIEKRLWTTVTFDTKSEEFKEE